MIYNYQIAPHLVKRSHCVTENEVSKTLDWTSREGILYRELRHHKLIQIC